jgi:Domain of unknown function (DUF1830)
MPQTLTSATVLAATPILCFYINATSYLQIARITNTPSWNFERIVFPGERLLFNAAPDSQLEIQMDARENSARVEPIPCDRLYVSQWDS